jgi:hypothetical protein
MCATMQCPQCCNSCATATVLEPYTTTHATHVHADCPKDPGYTGQEKRKSSTSLFYTSALPRQKPLQLATQAKTTTSTNTPSLHYYTAIPHPTRLYSLIPSSPALPACPIMHTLSPMLHQLCTRTQQRGRRPLQQSKEETHPHHTKRYKHQP